MRILLVYEAWSGDTGWGRGPAGSPRAARPPAAPAAPSRVVDVAVSADAPLGPGDDPGAVDGDHSPRDAGLLRRDQIDLRRAHAEEAHRAQGTTRDNFARGAAMIGPWTIRSAITRW